MGPGGDVPFAPDSMPAFMGELLFRHGIVPLGHCLWIKKPASPCWRSVACAARWTPLAPVDAPGL